MEIIKKITDKELTVEVIGRLDAVSSPSLEAAINESITEITSLIFDFKKLDYISSAGLRVLLIMYKKMQVFGTMKLVNVSPEVMEILSMTGFLDFITIE